MRIFSRKQQKSKIFELSSRKGQGLSMNVIIIAAISLLVLVILAVLVINAGSNLGGANTCEDDEVNSVCVSKADCVKSQSEDGEGGRVGSQKCDPEQYTNDEICCRLPIK